jgi:HAE1 family hydrophobic/amphiphilic exporter-1
MLYTFTAVPGLIQKSGILQIGQRRYRMKVKTPEFWDYKKTDAFFKKLEKLFINNKNRLNLLAVSTSFSVSGGRFSFFMNEEEHKGLGLKESRTALKDILPIDWPGVRFRVFGEGNIGNTGDMQGISVNLSADDSALIEPYINEFADQLRLINEITSVNTEFEKGQKELIFEPDLEACENYGVSPSDIARYISFSSRGTKAGWFDTPKGEYEVTLRMHKRDVKSLGQIKNFLIPSTSVSDGIPLERLVKSRYRHGPESITRKQGRAVISVNIECASEKLDIVKKKIKEISRAVNLPPGCEIQFDPAFDKSDEALRVIFSTLGIAFILIYFIMASLFESLFQPFVIIFTFPFGAFGVIWTLFLTDTPFDIMSGCGALILAGIVVNNAIVLIDSINSHRKTGLERFAAVKEAALLRLRPVLMTGLTTVFGLIPMLIGGATQASKIYSGLARAVMGGLSAAIIFTLLFIPVIYIVIENIVNFFRKAFSFLFCEKP